MGVTIDMSIETNEEILMFRLSNVLNANIEAESFIQMLVDNNYIELYSPNTEFFITKKDFTINGYRYLYKPFSRTRSLSILRVRITQRVPTVR